MSDTITDLGSCTASLDDVVGGNERVILFFSAPWSERCADIEALVEPNLTESADETIRVNVEKYQAVASTYNVSALPTAVYLYDGEEERRAAGQDIEAFEREAQRLRREE